MKPILPVLLLLPALPACAQTGETLPDLGGSITQMLFGLAVVIALLFAALWSIKRLSAPRGAAGHLKVLGGAALGPRERVMLVEVAGKVLVLGVTQNNVRTLHTLDAADLPATPGGESGAPAVKDFSAWLRQSVERRKHDA